MPIGIKMQMAFGGVWFGLRFLDYLLPPLNAPFNAALALLFAISIGANHFERLINTPRTNA